MKAILATGLVLGLACSSTAPVAPWTTDEVAGFSQARIANKAVLIDFPASWSMPSVELSSLLDTLSAEIDRDFVRVRLDVSDVDRADKLRERYQIGVLPLAVMVDLDGTVLGRIDQVLDVGMLRATIAKAAGARHGTR